MRFGHGMKKWLSNLDYESSEWGERRHFVGLGWSLGYLMEGRCGGSGDMWWRLGLVRRGQGIWIGCNY